MRRRYVLAAIACVGFMALLAYWSHLIKHSVKPKPLPVECKLSSYWVICDDGFVVWSKGAVSDSSRATLCAEHGASDGRQIQVNAYTGHNWKVVVTPIEAAKP